MSRGRDVEDLVRALGSHEVPDGLERGGEADLVEVGRRDREDELLRRDDRERQQDVDVYADVVQRGDARRQCVERDLADGDDVRHDDPRRDDVAARTHGAVVAAGLEEQGSGALRDRDDERLEHAQEDQDDPDADQPAADGQLEVEDDADDHGDDAGDDELVLDPERLLGQDDDREPTARIRDRERLTRILERNAGLGQLCHRDRFAGKARGDRDAGFVSHGRSPRGGRCGDRARRGRCRLGGAGCDGSTTVDRRDTGRGRGPGDRDRFARQHPGRAWRLGHPAVEVPDEIAPERQDRGGQEQCQQADLAEHDDARDEDGRVDVEAVLQQASADQPPAQRSGDARRPRRR